jgi:sulfatase maturation enzyme AslB (radical SAM superfamily)
MIHLRLPWLLEAAIRGHFHTIHLLVIFYCHAEPAMPNLLQHYWTKILNYLPLSSGMKKEQRKYARGIIGNVCFACTKADSDDRKFLRCSKCKFYTYCGKECQLKHWNHGNHGNHRGECKQLQILNTYHKPYAKQIHEKIIRGDDPTEILEYKYYEKNSV